MALTEPQIEGIRNCFETGKASDALVAGASAQQHSQLAALAGDAQVKLGHAAPNGAGFQILFGCMLHDCGIELSRVVKLSVAYRLDGANRVSRKACVLGDQPVCGRLVANDPSITAEELTKLNADPRIQEALLMPEVFPARIRAIREIWIEIAAILLEIAGSKSSDAWVEAEAAAANETLIVALADFAGGGPGEPCTGTSCPGKPKFG